MLYEARNQSEHPYKNLDIAYGAPNNTDNWISNFSYCTLPTLQNSGQANSQDNPYIIDSAAKLAYLSYNPSWANEKYFLQTADIDLVEHYWVPINNVSNTTSSSRRVYYYDGGNHTISNLYINTAEQTLTSSSYIGLFGCVYGSSSKYAYIKNVNITSGSVSGNQYVGAIVGTTVYTDITNCSNQGVPVSGSGEEVGGVVGYHDEGNITSSYNTGDVTSTSTSNYLHVGGVVGYHSSGSITSSYNTGAVTGNGDRVGGIVGWNNYGSITSSYNEGAVTGNGDGVGGVVGDNNKGSITSSYNTGDVTSTSTISYSFVGGVVGYNNSGSITSSYNTGDVTGTGRYSYVGGVVGCNSGTISSSYNTGDVTGDYYVGGVAGYNRYGTISGSYNTGAVSGSSYVGGVAGQVQGKSSSKALISSCFSTGAVTRTSGSSTYFGGVVGYIENSTSSPSRYVSISWCYYNTETVGSVVTKAIGLGTGYQCYGLTTAQMQGLQSENYMYLSNSYWNFAPNAYPTLKYVVTTLDIVVETPPTNSGDNPVSP